MKILKNLVIISMIFSLVSNANSPTLTISRSRAHEDKSGPFTPLVVSFSTEDISTKVKPVDLICIVDISGSMYGDPINLVKQSLDYLVNLMNDTDNFALVTFSNSATLEFNLTKMTQDNKEIISKRIKNLNADGATNIYSGLELGLRLLTSNYSSGDRIASMILLSDGEDNYNYGMVDELFKDLVEDTNKNDYVFNLNTFGYGDYHDYILMNDIALIKPGSYFFIHNLNDVNDCFLKIYGSLSTISDVNVQLKVQSGYNILKVYGIEDMYEANLINSTSTSRTLSTFETTLIQVIYGKRYEFVLLVDVPKNTPIGKEVLNATMPSLGLTAKYLWDGKYSRPAYEEYIKCIVVIIFEEGYEKSYSGIPIIEEGKVWMENNYNGTRYWAREFDGAINDLKKGNNEGNANLLSKITELKTSATIGIHYDEGNSYQRALRKDSHSLNLSEFTNIIIQGQRLISYIININYYYFYLKNGTGMINNMDFSGESSSLIIYTNDTSSGNINITSTSDSMDCYYSNKTVKRFQAYVDFNSIGKIMIKKEFPYDFYTPVDGKRDITFNIEFINIDLDSSINIGDILEIKAYILSDNDIDDIDNSNYLSSSFKEFDGLFDNKSRIGKIVINKEDIYYNLDSVHSNYLYVIIKVITGKSITISNTIQGQFIFIPNNYIYSSIPKNYRIYSNLEIEKNNPHLYTLDIGSSKNNAFLIEIENFGSELDFKILQYQNDIDGVIDPYNDYNEFNITRKTDNNKLYLNVTQSGDFPEEKIILSIFSKNEDHVSGSDINNLTYTFKYDTYYYIEKEKDIPITIPVIKRKIKFIILGFGKYVYIKTSKIINFFVYFVHIKTDKYTFKKISINTRIKYIKKLRLLDDNISKAACVLIENEFENQDKYNCSLDTSEEDIDNIQIDKNIEIDDENIEVSDVEVSPMAIKYINNLQNVGESDIFSKKLYIMQNSTINVDNKNNNFNITGYLDTNGFNHKSINLEVVLTNNSEQKIENITCNSLEEEKGVLTLQCSTKKEMTGILNNGFANLENENLMITLLDSEKVEKNKIDFKEQEDSNINIKVSSTGLSTGAIIAIIIPTVFILILTTGLIIFLSKKTKGLDVKNADQSTIIPNYSTRNPNINA